MDSIEVDGFSYEDFEECDDYQPYDKNDSIFDNSEIVENFAPHAREVPFNCFRDERYVNSNVSTKGFLGLEPKLSSQAVDLQNSDITLDCATWKDCDEECAEYPDSINDLEWRSKSFNYTLQDLSFPFDLNIATDFVSKIVSSLNSSESRGPSEQIDLMTRKTEQLSASEQSNVPCRNGSAKRALHAYSTNGKYSNCCISETFNPVQPVHARNSFSATLPTFEAASEPTCLPVHGWCQCACCVAKLHCAPVCIPVAIMPCNSGCHQHHSPKRYYNHSSKYNRHRQTDAKETSGCHRCHSVERRHDRAEYSRYRRSRQLDQQRELPRRPAVPTTEAELVCVSGLLMKQASDDLTHLLRKFGTGKIVEVLPCETAAVIRFRSWEKAFEFLRRYDGTELCGSRMKVKRYKLHKK